MSFARHRLEVNCPDMGVVTSESPAPMIVVAGSCDMRSRWTTLGSTSLPATPDDGSISESSVYCVKRSPAVAAFSRVSRGRRSSRPRSASLWNAFEGLRAGVSAKPKP